MMSSYTGSKIKRMNYNGQKVRKWYHDGIRVFTAGNVVTYKVDTNAVYTEEVDSETSCLSPKTFNPATTKPGWTFVGWREDGNASAEVLSEKMMGDDPITLYAVFKRNIAINVYYTTTPIVVSGARYYNNGKYLNPHYVFKQKDLTGDGWNAAGWAKDTTDASAKATYGNNEKVTIPETIWSMNLYGLYWQNVTLTTHANSTTTAKSQIRRRSTANTYANPKFTVADPSRSGATFMGWSNDGTARVLQKSIVNLELSANTTIYAVFLYPEKAIFKIDDDAIDKGQGTYRWYFGGAANGASNVTPNADLTHFRDIDCTNYSSLIVRVCALDISLSLSGATQNHINLYIGVVNAISENASKDGRIAHIWHKTCGNVIGTYSEGAANNKFADIALNVSGLNGIQSLYCIAASDTTFGSGAVNVYLSKILLAANYVIG